MCTRQFRVRRRTLHPPTRRQKNAVPDTGTQKKTGAAAPVVLVRALLEAVLHAEGPLRDVGSAVGVAVGPVVEARRLAVGELRSQRKNEGALREVVRRPEADMVAVEAGGRAAH